MPTPDRSYTKPRWWQPALSCRPTTVISLTLKDETEPSLWIVTKNDTLNNRITVQRAMPAPYAKHGMPFLADKTSPSNKRIFSYVPGARLKAVWLPYRVSAAS